MAIFFCANRTTWQNNNDPSCILCGKQLCTIPHILGACKYSLDQGRFTFRHDNVLSSLVSVIEAFIKNLKPAKLKKRNAIHFIKAGRKHPKTRSKPTGILHLSSDWELISDLDQSYVFPFQIALTELRPDVVIFSKSLKRCILVELTCPCEENMNSWHSTKLAKYSSLLDVIRRNNWYVDLFAVEVGARGFPAISLKCCLQKLGFPNKLVTQTVKQLGRISMESSFYIWMHRNSKEWTSQNTTYSSSNDPHFFNTNKVCQGKSNNTTPLKSVKQKAPPSRRAGFINKGNTCYINAILQALSVIPSFWQQQHSQSGTISPLVRALALNLSLVKKRTSPIDPSNFLRAFQNTISNKQGAPFNINTQQDVPEILQILIDELKGTSSIAEDLISSSILRSTTCDTCFSSSSQEEKHNIVSFPLTNSIQSSLDMFLKTEYLKDNDKWFCNFCNSLQVSVRECKFVNCGTIFILQLCRYMNVAGNLVKDNRKVKCPSELLNIPVHMDENGMCVKKVQT